MRGKSRELETLPGADVRPPCSLGDRISFVPHAFTEFKIDASGRLFNCEYAYTLAGTVIYINVPHRYYTLEAPCFGVPIRESFKF